MREEVKEYIRYRPKCEKLFRALSSCFEITFATDRKFHKAELTAFFAKPSKAIADAFGLNYEILGIYSAFPAAQARLAQAIEEFINEAPAAGRVDRIVVFVFSDDPAVGIWATQYAVDHPDSRIMIAAHAASLTQAINSSLALRTLLQQRLYHTDLFDYRLPLNSDAFYFGRSQDLALVTAAVGRGENIGIFGLRKTGKTSFLFKLRRVLEDQGQASLFYYDCKLPDIRSKRWNELLEKICKDISQKLGIKWKDQPDNGALADRFKQLIMRNPGGVVLAFDEFEFISPGAVRDPHWNADFIDFWQTIWGVQSQVRKLVAVISGVIPRTIEIEKFDGIQNPLFSIVRPRFLKGFPEVDVGVMVNTIGKKVGVSFDESAVHYLFERYGGHPYLTRLACSNQLEKLDAQAAIRPLATTRAALQRDQDAREREIIPYVRHVVADLREFYPIEYEVLEMLSLGKYSEYHELAIEPEFVDHLKRFGIIISRDSHDEISIPIAKQFIAAEYLRRNNMKVPIEVVPIDERQEWYRLRTKAILDGIRDLAQHFRRNLKRPFLPVGGVPEADRLVAAPIATDDYSFGAFCMAANRCLVESIEAFLKEKNVARRPLFDYLPGELPKLSRALQRLKVYRHESGHLELSDPAIRELLAEFLSEDLAGRPKRAVPEVDFVLQQSIIDGLMHAVQAELVAQRLV